MRLIMKSMVLSCLLIVGLVAKENKNVETDVLTSDIQVYTTANKDKKITPKTIQEAFEKAGFFVSANRDMNAPFKTQFKETGFEVYNLFTFYKRDVAVELVKKYQNIGLFTPMSMSIYTKKGEDTISVSTLSVEAMAKIMKIPSDDKVLTDLGALVVETLEKALPNGKFETLSYSVTKPTGELVTSYTMEMDAEEWEDELDELKMGLEGELSPNGFVIAGHNNLGDEFEDAQYEGFDFYEVYSICKLPVIYTIAKTRPEAGAFAPCSLYLAKKKGENEMNIAFPSVYNWMSSLAIKDKKEIEVLEDAEKKMNVILNSLTE